MRRIAIINQKGGVGKTTTAVNLGAALARLGRRVLVVDMDPQANASTNLGVDLGPGEPSSYSVLVGATAVADAVRATATPNLWLLPAHLDLSGAELELASAIGRETILRDALEDWAAAHAARDGEEPVDYVLIDNPPSLGLLSVNGLAAANEVLIAVQTEFFALQGLSKLVEVVQLLRRKLNPALEITGVLACLYDNRLRLAREVLAELRAHFPEQSFKQTIGKNVKLAECPSFGQTIFEYAPDSPGAKDHLRVAAEVIAREALDPELARKALPTPDVDAVERALAARPLPEAPPRRADGPESAEDTESAAPAAAAEADAPLQGDPAAEASATAATLAPGSELLEVTLTPSAKPAAESTAAAAAALSIAVALEEEPLGAVEHDAEQSCPEKLAEVAAASPAEPALAAPCETEPAALEALAPAESAPLPATEATDDTAHAAATAAETEQRLVAAVADTEDAAPAIASASAEEPCAEPRPVEPPPAPEPRRPTEAVDVLIPAPPRTLQIKNPLRAHGAERAVLPSRRGPRTA